MSYETFRLWIADPQGPVTQFLLNFLGASAILLVGMWAARALSKQFRRALGRTRLDPTVQAFLGSFGGWALILGVVVAALHEVGIETTSFVAIFGAAGLGVGLALQGSLANFAAGLIIAMFRPIRLEDYIAACDIEGFVKDISIVNTTLLTLDNETVVLPNAEITAARVINYSVGEFVRV